MTSSQCMNVFQGLLIVIKVQNHLLRMLATSDKSGITDITLEVTIFKPLLKYFFFLKFFFFWNCSTLSNVTSSFMYFSYIVRISFFLSLMFFGIFSTFSNVSTLCLANPRIRLVILRNKNMKIKP